MTQLLGKHSRVRSSLLALSVTLGSCFWSAPSTAQTLPPLLPLTLAWAQGKNTDAASGPGVEKTAGKDEQQANVATARLDRARKIIATEAMIAKAVFEVSRGQPTAEESRFIEDIESKERVHRLLAADIANDGQNLARAGIVMPWEMRTRDVQRDLMMGQSPFRRKVSSGSLALAQSIGDRQLASVQQLIDDARAALIDSRIRRAWATLSPEQQSQCDEYQPEFAAEASGRNDRELIRLTEEIRNLPTSPHLIARGELYASRGKTQQAYDDFSEALAKMPENDQVRLWRAELAAELGNSKGAVSDYQIVAEKRGQLSDQAYVAWGQLLEQRSPAEAMSKAAEALKINKNCAAAHSLWANLYKRYNQRQMTLDALKAAAQAAPDDPSHYYRLANIQAGLRETDEAIKSYTQSITIDPTWWKPYAGRSTLHFQKGDVAASLKDLDEAAEWAPREPSIYENRAVVLKALGRLDEAKQDQARAKTLAAGGVL